MKCRLLWPRISTKLSKNGSRFHVTRQTGHRVMWTECKMVSVWVPAELIWAQCGPHQGSGSSKPSSEAQACSQTTSLLAARVLLTWLWRFPPPGHHACSPSSWTPDMMLSRTVGPGSPCLPCASGLRSQLSLL